MRKAETRVIIEGYTEKHHVFPKSIFGKNNRIVILTAKEHYIAHAFLEKIYIKRYGMRNKNTHKMIRAFFMMNNATSSSQQRYINSKLYEVNRLHYSESVSGKNSPMYGKKRVFSTEHLTNLRATYKKGVDNPLYGKTRSKEVRDKIRAAKQNISTETCEKISNARKGMVFSDEHRLNLSISHKGNSLTAETRAKIGIANRGKVKKSRGKTKYVLEITDPLGITEVVTNIREYCESRGMPKAMDTIKWIARGKAASDTYKNYKIRLIDNTGDTR